MVPFHAFSDGVFIRGVWLLLLLSWTASAAPLSLLTWNVAGNGATDWTTNAAQVRAIGRVVQYVRPDIVTFQEIPNDYVTEMTNFVSAFLPGYFLARYSGTDGILRSVIVSRYPISREQRWLDGVLLNDFGYDGRFTRDLFEAEISVPQWSMPLHIFTTHLKSGFDADSISRRGAEALAISNFVVNTYYPTWTNQPFVLTGDFNEDVMANASYDADVVPKLTNSAVGLILTTPVNPTTKSERTFSIRASLQSRLDYILPNGLLYSNILASQTVRTDVLNPTPSVLNADDDRTASDHLGVLMIFDNPYSVPFRVTQIDVNGGFLSLRWESRAGSRYSVESTSDFTNWQDAATGILTGGTEGLWNTTAPATTRFYRLFEEPPP
ncbi:hypothetical protein GC207_09400 [bacterium]|nr:hypothetical protein [bacterium]